MGYNLNVSIVLFDSAFDQIANIIKGLKTLLCLNKIYLIDNSSSKNIAFENCGATYIFNGKNIGYGAGHNIALQKSINDGVKYHLVINADICIESSDLEKLFEKLENNPEIGSIMPKILNPDGSIQILPKLLPTPLDLLIRVIIPLKYIFHSINKEYTLENYTNEKLNVPIISGCFSLLRVEALKNVGIYDEHFFMYFEDFDLSRRIHSKYQTIYYPAVSIIHTHERGAAKSFKLFKIFIRSAIIYFNKYGWFIDQERNKINETVLKQLK